MIPSLPLREICQAFDLGRPLSPVEAVPGGRLHRLGHLRTDRGEFAVKVINLANLVRQKENVLSPENAQHVAAAMQKKDIPTVVALQQAGQYTFSVASQSYLVMPWITGSLLPPEKISVESNHLIGKLLANIQQAPCKTAALPNWVGLDKKKWLHLLQNIPKDAEISEKLFYAVSDLAAWSKRAKSASRTLQRELVFSHRDFDVNNVLWQNIKSPVILDWEYAGLIHPLLDLFIVALNWSNVQSGIIHKVHFKAVFAGYSKVKPLTASLSSTIISGYLGYCLAWLEYNIQKLNEDPSASVEISQTITAMQAVSYGESSLLTCI